MRLSRGEPAGRQRLDRRARHPDMARSVNRLWHLAADGTMIKTWDLGENSLWRRL